jgi:hypothetical protein
MTGHAVQAQLLAYAASVRTRQSRSQQARRIGLAAAQLAEECGAQTALAEAYNSLCMAETQLGRGDEASAYARRAYELFEALGDLEGRPRSPTIWEPLPITRTTGTRH